MLWSGNRRKNSMRFLLDAPCSATGTFRRHPEVLFRARPAIIAQSAELQRDLLNRAATWLKPGGELVYSVCSLEIEEGEEVVARSSLQIPTSKSIRRVLMNCRISSRSRMRDGFGSSLDLLEEFGGLDGFFMARLVRERIIPV